MIEAIHHHRTSCGGDIPIEAEILVMTSVIVVNFVADSILAQLLTEMFWLVWNIGETFRSLVSENVKICTNIYNNHN